MTFDICRFPIFFTLAVLLYFSLPVRLRTIGLVLTSCYFYMYFVPKYIFILFFLILVDYFAALAIERSETSKKPLLILSVAANIGVLFVFKYFNFFNGNLAAFFQAMHLNYPVGVLSLILPIGLSFHTFQSLAYVIEVYRGNFPAERRLDRYALYVLFWPQLVAGPIERPQNLLRQIQEPRAFSVNNVVIGFRWILLGYFKKLLIADMLASYVDTAYAPEYFHSHTGFFLILPTYCFAIQIWADFSGYTDIARGSAKIMGFDLMQNFAGPYFAQSCGDFWRRWHISLSTWFRDYVYRPFVGRQPRILRRCLGYLLVFAVSGLWHGANWTFVAWGLLHGVFLTCGYITRDWRQGFRARIGLSSYPRVEAFVRMAVTFNLVSLAWILFRSSSVEDAWYIIRHLFPLGRIPATGMNFINLALRPEGIAFAMLIAGMGLALREIVGKENWLEFDHYPIWLRWGIYYAAIFGVVLLGVADQRTFIYFQF